MNTAGRTARELCLAVQDADRRQRRAEADKIMGLVALCEVYRGTDTWLDPTLPGAEQLVAIGADGTPVVSDFLALEVGAMLGLSEASAGMLLCDALNLRHRHPVLWQAVGDLKVEVWKARRIVSDVARSGLPLEAAQAIDEKITPFLDQLPYGAVLRTLAKLIVAADTVLAEQRARKARLERFVRIRHDLDGVSTLIARLATTDAMALDDALTRAASDAILTGRPETVDELRSEALGNLALAYLNNPNPDAPATRATGRRIPRVAEVVVHIAEETLQSGHGVARVEKVGPMLLAQVLEMLPGCQVRVLPVIDLNDDPGVDAYEIPDRIRQQVNLRNPIEVFPFSSKSSANCDLDHTRPYRHGQLKPALQTRTSNLGPLSRKAHRAKTLGAWTLTQPTPGEFFWTSPMGLSYTVDRNGTTRGVKRTTTAATAKVADTVVAVKARRRPLVRRRP